MSAVSTVALIVNTFDQPEYLVRVLSAAARQTRPPDEVIVADDGSGEETRRVVETWLGQHPKRGRHVWQEKKGFRRSRILNEAIASAQSDYLVFLDGDSVPHPRFVADHLALREPGRFVQGHRALVERRAAAFFGLGGFESDRRRALWRGQLRGLKHAFRWPIPLKRIRTDLRGVRGCNLAIWRTDLVAVNGYNEAFEGWGREDSELSVRLMNRGTQRMDVRGWAICYHLWHAPVSREQLPANDRLLADAISSKATTCLRGLNLHRQ